MMIFLLALLFVVVGVIYSVINFIVKFNTGNYIDFNYLDLLGKVGYDTYEPYSPITEWTFVDNYLWEHLLLGNFGYATIEIGLIIGVCGYIYSVIVDKVRP